MNPLSGSCIEMTEIRMLLLFPLKIPVYAKVFKLVILFFLTCM